MAVDLGTSFISTAVAARSPKKPPRHFLIKTFRYPLNLAGFALEEAGFSGGAAATASRLTQVFKDAFLKVFREAHNTTRRLDAVLLGLADPFFLEAKFSKKIIRKNAKSKITRPEIDDILKELENEVRHQHSSLLPIGREISGVKVNGYDIDAAEGYAGKTLEIEAIFTLITPSLKDFFSDAKEKFFPHSPVNYFSDAGILRRMALGNNSSAAILNIDGEVTSIFYLDQAGLNHVGMASFGFSTFARRLASIFKISRDEALSLFRQFLEGTLEESRDGKVRSALDGAGADWWALLQTNLKSLRSKPPKKLILTGREPNLSALTPFFKKNFENFYGATVDAGVFPKNDLSKDLNNNPFLAGLIAFSSW